MNNEKKNSTEFNVKRESPIMKPDFIMGVATSSYQIEGAVDADGRVPSIWDTFCSKPGKVLNGDNGDVACDNYNRYREDIDLIKDLGFNAYRLSIAWPRIIKDRQGNVNQAGIDFYCDQVNYLNEQGIKPFVTLYHWDLPQYLEDHGGWANRETAYAFEHYVDVISKALGDKVAGYITLNEPWCSAVLGYDIGIHAPGLQDRKIAMQATHHLLLAHGLAMSVVRVNAPETDCGITLNFYPVDVEDNNTSDYHARDLAYAEANLLFLQPLLEGSYPEILFADKPFNRPLILEGDMAIISQSLDFIGVNYYTRKVVKADSNKGYREIECSTNDVTSMGWEIYPHGLLRMLRDLGEIANIPPLYITENGMADFDQLDDDDEVYDYRRVKYFNDHLLAVEQAIMEGVDIRGYFAWSFLDNFEWAEGYSKRFGLVYVDFETQKRTKKLSAKAFQHLLANK